jgi:superfamily II DNA or RNA helicase
MDGFLRVPENHPKLPEILDELKLEKDGETFEIYEYNEEFGEVCIPRCYATSFIGDTVYDMTSDGRHLDHTENSLFKARDGQDIAIRDTLQTIHSEGGSLLIAACGTGKTVMGAEIALKIGVSTCILVHKEFLAKQWEEAFRMLAPWITVGRMQRDVVDTGRTHDIVIAVTQSVVNSRRDYGDSFYDSFGLIICDEVHRYGAALWQKAITRFPARYRLGLTATPSRQDGLWKVITKHISSSGPVLEASTLTPDVYVIKTDVKIPQKVWYKPWLDKKAQRAVLVTALASHVGRNEAVLRYIIRAYNAGRKVLVISERRAQLDYFSQRLATEGMGADEVGFYVGGTKQAKLDIAAQKSIILSTYQMASEGLNIPDLDTLIMATPQNSIQQTVGRILRIFEGKGAPVVLDFFDEKMELVLLKEGAEDLYDVDLSNPFEGGMEFRRRQYKKLRYTVHG